MPSALGSWSPPALPSPRFGPRHSHTPLRALREAFKETPQKVKRAQAGECCLLGVPGVEGPTARMTWD